MKNNANRLFALTIALLLACSFVNKPVSAEAAVPNRHAMEKVPVGGAYVFFAGKYSGDITKQELASQTEVQVEGCAKGARIFKFTLAITKGGNTVTCTTDSNVLTPDMRTRLNSLSKGDAFEFRQIKAYIPNGKDVVDVRGARFTIA